MSNIVQSFVDRISESWRESVKKILETSQILVESENQLNEIEFMDMVSQLPMSQSTISKLLMIGKNNYLPQQTKYLPPHWTTIYEISTLDNNQIDKGIEEGFINPSSIKKDIDKFKVIHIEENNNNAAYWSKRNMMFNFEHVVSKPESFVDYLMSRFDIEFDEDLLKKGIVIMDKRPLENVVELDFIKIESTLKELGCSDKTMNYVINQQKRYLDNL